MFSDRGIQVDHTTLFRWIQTFAPELDKRIRPHLRMTNGSWRMDETYVRVKGEWVYLYRAVDATGQTIDFLLSPKRDAAAARPFFRKALGQPPYGQSANHHCRQERRLSSCHEVYETCRRALAFRQTPAGEISE